MTGIRPKRRAKVKARPKPKKNRAKPKTTEARTADTRTADTRTADTRIAERLDPATRLARLTVDAPGVEAAELPHRPLLEERFLRPLDDVEVLTGPAVAAALDGLDARAAELDGRVYLPSPDAPVDVVAHEVAHTLQRPDRTPRSLAVNPATGPEGSPTVTSPHARAERDAHRLAVHGGAPTAVLPAGTVALLQQSSTDPQPSTNSGADAPAADSKTSDAQSQDSTSADSQAQDNGTGDPAAEGGQPAIEEAKPTFAPPALPDTQLSPEEEAKRKAEKEEAQKKFDQAESAGGTVGAIQDMLPSAKAANQGAVGERVGQVVAEDQKKFQSEIPAIEAKMGGEPDDAEVPKVEAPAIGDVKLQDGQVAPTQKPDLPPTADPGKYQGNNEVKTLMEKFFSIFGFGRDSIHKSFKEVKTGDDIETSAGPKPKVPREKGTETDDERIDRDKAAAKDESEKAGLDAQKKVIEGPGPEQAKPREVTESRTVGELKAIEAPAVVPAEGATAFQQVAAREDESLLAQFDADQHESMKQSFEEARTKTEEAEKERDEGRKAELDKAETDRKAEEEKADGEQRQKVLGARTTIQEERQKTVDAQAEEVKSVETKAEKARKEERGKIQKRVEEDERKISTKYDEKEGEAKKEVEKGETQADAKKKEAEKKSEETSWWDRAKSWVKDQFNKLTAAIGKIFDGVRKLVKAALDAARKFAKDLIDAAAAFLKKAIEAFGELAKGLVNVLVGTFFPDLAKKLNEKIDGAVSLAKKGIDKAAEGLKKGVDAVVDALEKGINAVLDAFQGAIHFAINLVQAAITGDWGAVFKQLLEAALKLLGIDPKEFYAFIAKVQETLGLIVDAPGKFLGNVLGAVKLGFSLFADNFLQHLKAGIIGWLTGSLGGDIQIPKTFDLLGILDLVRQVLGLTWDWLKERAAKVIGEKNVERLEYLFSYVDVLRKEGWGGLFTKLKEDLTGLKDQVLGKIGEFLSIQVIKAAVLWLAGLFNPVAGLVKVVMTVWNIYTFLRDQLSRMIEVVKTVVGALDKIARGVLEEAGKKVESVLGLLVPVAIDLLAKLLGLTGVTAKVREILKSVRQSITKTVDKVLKKVAAKFKGGVKKAKAAAKKVGKKILGAILWWKKEKKFQDQAGQSHKLYLKRKGKKAEMRVQSRDQAVENALKPKTDDSNEVKLKKGAANTAYSQVHETLAQIYAKEDELDRNKKGTQQVKDALRADLDTLSTTLDTRIEGLSLKMRDLSIGEAVLAKSMFQPLGDGAKMEPLSNLPGNSKGQENTDQNLPAWRWLMMNWESDKYYESNWVRMHLVHHSLHGDGMDARNLAVAPEATNKAFLNKAESNAIKAIRGNPPQVLTYRAEIVPHGNIEGLPPTHQNKFPKAVYCHWTALTFQQGKWESSGSIPRITIDTNIEKPLDRSGDTDQPIFELSIRDLGKVVAISHDKSVVRRLHQAMQKVSRPGGLTAIQTAYEALPSKRLDMNKEWTDEWQPVLQAKIAAWNQANPDSKPVALTASGQGATERLFYDLSVRDIAKVVGGTPGQAAVVRLHKAAGKLRGNPSATLADLRTAYLSLDELSDESLQEEWRSTWATQLSQKVTAWNTANPNDKDVVLQATPNTPSP